MHFAFYKAKGELADLAIRTGSSLRHRVPVPYSHVELLSGAPLHDRDNCLPYQECIAASKRDGKMVRRKVIHFKPSHWDFVNAPAPEGMWDEASKLIGAPYDVVGAGLCITPWAREKPGKYWCSQMIAHLQSWNNSEWYDPFMVYETLMRNDGKLIPV